MKVPAPICGQLCPLIRVNSKEATRFAMCRLPQGHTGPHSEVEGDHPVTWTPIEGDIP